MSSTSSSSSIRSLASSQDKNSLTRIDTAGLLVRDFGWPNISPRYHGDHTQESNPDWDHDPLESEEAQKEAFQKMEKSYAIYMGNLSGQKSPATKKRATWAKFLPWIR